jgi:UDP-N-acetylglucosamine diphosphorylase/glucosamine-1-phosphate N-acetyltransferase
MINICIYEDNSYTQLYPLTYTRTAYQLFIGTNLILNKIEHFFPSSNITLHCRNELKPTVKLALKQFPINKINNGTSCLFINGRTILTQSLHNTLSRIDTAHNHLFLYKGNVVAAFLKGAELDKLISQLALGPIENTFFYESVRKKAITKQLNQCQIIQYPWDLIQFNNDIIHSDFILKDQPGIIKGNLRPYVSIYNEDYIFIDTHTSIEDYVVLDARKGPIYIEKNVTITAHSRIEGPAFIGKNSVIMGASLKCVSIGPSCKIGGDLSHSIIYGNSNKAHDGYIGNSYIGEWVNLGAGTTTSNLKNNYTEVSMTVNGKVLNTKQLLLGSIIGDYVKTSIHTSLNTGSLIGIGSTIFDVGLHAKVIPPFQWGSPQHYTRHQFDKFINTTKVMMSRRSATLTKTHEQLLQWLYTNT